MVVRRSPDRDEIYMWRPPKADRIVAYECAGGWYFRDPVWGGAWHWTDDARMALRWGAAMFRVFQ